MSTKETLHETPGPEQDDFHAQIKRLQGKTLSTNDFNVALATVLLFARHHDNDFGITFSAAVEIKGQPIVVLVGSPAQEKFMELLDAIDVKCRSWRHKQGLCDCNDTHADGEV